MAALTALAVGLGLVSGVGSLINTAYSHWQYGDQKEYNTEMSNTVYQRTVEDMKKAGLNPAMMYGGGGATAESSLGVNANGGTPLNFNYAAQGIQAAAGIMSSAAQVMSVNKNPNSKTYQSAANIIASVEKYLK